MEKNMQDHEGIRITFYRKVKGGEEKTELSLPAAEISTAITSSTIDFAKEFGEYLAYDSTKRNEWGEIEKDKKGNKKNITALNSTQLRKFFGEVKRQQIKKYEESRFVLLKPKLAYAVGRNKDNKVRYLYEVLSQAIDIVVKAEDNNKAFKNFVALFEAIVAYHKSVEKVINN